MNEAQKYLQEIISKRKKGEKTMIFDKIKRTIHKDKRRKVIVTLINGTSVDEEPQQLICYFRKTLVIDTIKAELETMEGELMYVNPGEIKFID